MKFKKWEYYDMMTRYDSHFKLATTKNIVSIYILQSHIGIPLCQSKFFKLEWKPIYIHNNIQSITSKKRYILYNPLAWK